MIKNVVEVYYAAFSCFVSFTFVVSVRTYLKKIKLTPNVIKTGTVNVL